MHRILIVDDHPVVRQGLVTVIDGQEGLSVCGAAGSAEEALDLFKESSPDLVLVDLTLPGRNGVELIKELTASNGGTRVLVMSMHDELIYAERVLRAGGRGFVMKAAPSEVLLAAIRKVLDGGVSVSEAVANHLLGGLSGKDAKEARYPLQRLTDRELEVFELIGRGKGNTHIAGLLSVSPRTIDAHKAHIREKLGLPDSNELTRYAVRWIETSALE